jgi:hypothetical protein
MPIFATFGPDHHDHSVVQQPNGRDPFFAIILPIIEELELWSLEDLGRIGEIQAAFDQRALPLRRIERDRH